MNEQQMPHQRPRVLTGLRANNSLTIANYLGAMLPMARLAKKHADSHDFFMFVPDLHSFTTQIDHAQLYQNGIQNIKYYIAAGAIDLTSPHLRVYRQSFVPQHAELTWILDCFTYMGELSRMTQFKDKSGTHAAGGHQNESVSVGLFNYPVLMAADILLYNAQYVPLGDDQKQHLEITRDLGLRLNERFKDVFPQGLFTTVPEPWQRQLEFSGLNKGLRIRSLRDPVKKMSKSDADEAGVIMLGDDPAKAAKKIMAATTDSIGKIQYDWENQPGVANLLQMLSLLQQRELDDVVRDWQGKTQYGELKAAVAQSVSEFLMDFQQKFANIDEQGLLQKLQADEAYARDIAAAQLLRVQQAVGLRQRS